MAWTTPRTWVALEKVTAALLNTHLRDNLSAAFPNGTGWTTYSPTYANITVGDGTVVARWAQAGETADIFWQLTLGSSSSIGSNPTVSLPANFANSINIFQANCRLTDANGTTTYQGSVFVTDTTMQPRYLNVSGSNVLATAIGTTTPFTWASGDTIRMQVSGELA